MTLNCIWLWGFYPEAWEDVEYLFIAFTPGQHWPGVVEPVRVPSMDQIEPASRAWHWTASDDKALVLEFIDFTPKFTLIRSGGK